jgi:hypothetical protein
MGALSTSSYRWIILLLATLVQVGVSILQQAPAASDRSSPGTSTLPEPR